MPNLLDTQSQLPKKREFAGTFYFLGRIGFWVQLVLGIASGITLLLVGFSRNISPQSNAAIGFGIFLAVCGIIALGFRIYWAWRYTQLARELQSSNPRLHPRRQEIIRVLRLGLLISLAGLSLAFLATEITTIAVLARAIAQPQGVAVYDPETIVRAMDLFLIVANVNIVGAHFLGSVNSLGLLNWITRE